MIKKIITILKPSFFLICCVCVLTVSCEKNAIFHQFVSIDEKGWHEDSLAVFSVQVTDTVGSYDVVLDVRNRNEYPYQNLFLFISSTSPDNYQVSDTLNCILSDELGRWQGKGFGSVSSLPILYMSDIKFPKQGEYVFQIRHGMREHLLPGINDIGLRVQKATKN